MPRENKRKKPSLTVQITISLIIGIVAGIAMQSIPDIAEGYVKPFGTIYLNLIKMIVVPVVVLSIIQGIVSLQDVRKVGSIGIKTIAFYLVTTAIAVTLGLVAANLLQVLSLIHICILWISQPHTPLLTAQAVNKSKKRPSTQP